MQLLPLVGFYWRRNQQISKLVAGGKTTNSHLVLDILEANAPILKKQFPSLNDDGLLDDFITTMKEVLAPPVNTQS